MTLEYSIISQQIIYSFDIGIFWLLNLVKWLLLLKWLIYGNDYLRFYNNVDDKDQKENLGDL